MTPRWSDSYVLVAKYKAAPDGLRRMTFERIYSDRQELDFRKRHAHAESITELSS